MKPLSMILALGVALHLAPCSGDDKADDGAIPDTALGDAAAADTSAPDGPAGADPWKAVSDRLEAEAKGGKIKGGFVMLDVYRQSDGKLVYSRAFGAKAPARTKAIPVASASKWVTSTVILALVADGTLSLDDTTGKWLKWTGVKGTITLRQLLTFTSGLRDPVCIYNPLTTFKACVDTIRDDGIKSVPGKAFYYAGAHMHVAGRMAEVATGKTFKQLFSAKVGGPAKLHPDVAYYASPKNKSGKLNPLLSGGLVISVADYGAFLAALVGPKASLLPAKLVAEQRKEQWAPGTKVEYTPPGAGKAHYALGCWRQCAKPDDVTACDADLVINSAGAYGFVPWHDVKHGYYAVLGAEADSTKDKASEYNVKLMYETLRPLIVKALGK